jgi:hypothetical protein
MVLPINLSSISALKGAAKKSGARRNDLTTPDEF